MYGVVSIMTSEGGGLGKELPSMAIRLLWFPLHNRLKVFRIS